VIATFARRIIRFLWLGELKSGLAQPPLQPSCDFGLGFVNGLVGVRRTENAGRTFRNGFDKTRRYKDVILMAFTTTRSWSSAMGSRPKYGSLTARGITFISGKRTRKTKTTRSRAMLNGNVLARQAAGPSSNFILFDESKPVRREGGRARSQQVLGVNRAGWIPVIPKRQLKGTVQ